MTTISACLRRGRTLGALLAATVLGTALLAGAAPAGAQSTDMLTFGAIAETYADASAPTTVRAGEDRLRADASPERVIYLRFVVAGVEGRPVEQARVRLEVSGSSRHGGSIHRISDGTWSAATLTFANRPAVDGPPLATLGAVRAGTLVEFDVTAAIGGDGVYDFAVDTDSSDGVWYVSSAAGLGQVPTLVLTVPAGPNPAVRILAPAAGTAVFVGDPVTFEGTAVDALDGDVSDAIVWHSDLDGALGAGALVTAALQEGLHTVTATVTDRDGLRGSASTAVRILPPRPADTPPRVMVTAPLEGQRFGAGEPAVLQGSADDLEDGDLTARLVWTSDVDGPLGMGGAVTRTLTVGTHRITAAVSDGAGFEVTVTRTVTVDMSATAAFAAVADTYVDAGAPTSNFGSTRVLRADLDIERVSYLRFVVSGVGTAVRTAHLRLMVDPDARGAQSDHGGTVHAISDTTWSEHGVTHADRPAVDGPALASLGAVAEGQLVDVDVTGAVTGDGVYSFALVSPSTDGVAYFSREGSVPPTLVLTLPGSVPLVTVTAPQDGTVVSVGDAVTFTGAATDAEDGDLSARIVWSSNRAGTLGTGPALTTSALGVGLHTVTGAVTDRGGLRGTAQVALYVRAPNAAPVVAVTAPADGTVVRPETPITFAASASDDFDGDVGVAVEWSSDLDGPLGGGATLTTTLGEGAHVVSATVTDSDGARGSATIRVAVQAPPPGTPMISIVAPRDGAAVALGEAVSLLGVADDPEDGLLTAGIVWSSDLDGALGAGGDLARTLSRGQHLITATVTDRNGLTAVAEAAVLVAEAGTVVLAPVADTYVDARRPSSTRGSASKLLGDASPERLFFLRFAVTDIAPFVVREARLRLTVGAGSSDGSPHGGTVHPISDRTWSEATTTYANRPRVDGPALASAGAVSPGGTVELDVSAALRAEGVYDFAVVSPATNGVAYRSREASTGRPELVVRLGRPRVTLSGTFLAPYRDTTLAPDTLIDALAATFLAAPADSHTLNLAGGAGIRLLGGRVLGQYDRSWGWDLMHSYNDAGVAFENPSATIEGVRVDNMTDGIRPRDAAAGFAIRHVRLSYIRDDCVENDHLWGGLVDDSLFDGCYVAFSARPSTEKMANGVDGSGRVWRIQNSLVRLEPMVGSSTTALDGRGHGGFFKWHSWNDPALSLSPRLALHRNVFMAERVGEVGAERMGIPPGQLASCSNNVMVWLGPGPYPAPLPPCFTVTTDRAVWDAAVADWTARHPDVAP